MVDVGCALTAEFPAGKKGERLTYCSKASRTIYAALTNLYALINLSIDLFSRAGNFVRRLRFNLIKFEWKHDIGWHDVMTPTPSMSERLINELKQLEQYLERKRNSLTTSISSTENVFFLLFWFSSQFSKTSMPPLTIACDLNYFCMTVGDDIRPRVVSLSFFHSLHLFIE